jgi:hypothetical protein
MNTMMNAMPAITWPMLIVWLLVAAVLVLGAGALLKYLLFSK